LTTGIRASSFTASWLSASELNQAVRQFQIGGGERREGLFYSISRKERGG
jgi:hypothetical protein